MLDIKDVQTTLDKNSFMGLVDTYKKRQTANIQTNENIMGYFLREFSFLKSYLDFFEDDNLTKFTVLMILILNSPDPSLKKLLLEKLHYYGYHASSELLVAMQLADKFSTKDINCELFFRSLKGLTTVYGCRYHDDKSFIIDTAYGDIEFLNAALDANVPEISPDHRRGYCHDVVAAFLCAFPNMVGAYYYIPLQFQGSIEHSVIIDEEHNQVLDFTNNITLPLDYFKKCYSNYAFVISGRKFKDFSEFFKGEYGEKLNMAILEEVRRTRKKNGM